MDIALRILLVDDDEDDKLLFVEALADIKKQIHCEYYNSGERALKWLATTIDLPHYIFLDLNMPRMNGIDLLKEIKGKPQFQHIPVIIYSTSRNEMHQKEAKRLGASLYIIKPYRQRDLKNEIQFVIENIKPAM